MCGRYHIDISEEELRNIVNAAAGKAPPDEMSLMKTSGEIFPTDRVPVMSGPETFQPMQWGFTLEGIKGPPIINARQESLMEKPMFKKEILRHRCLVPCSGYYEWKKASSGKGKGMKHYFHLLGKGTMYLAAIWRMERGANLPRFSIITRDAVGDLADIHDRMPVIIPRELIDTWLTESSQIAEVLRQATTEIGFENLDAPEPNLFDMM